MALIPAGRLQEPAVQQIRVELLYNHKNYMKQKQNLSNVTRSCWYLFIVIGGHSIRYKYDVLGITLRFRRHSIGEVESNKT